MEKLRKYKPTNRYRMTHNYLDNIDTLEIYYTLTKKEKFISNQSNIIYKSKYQIYQNIIYLYDYYCGYDQFGNIYQFKSFTKNYITKYLLYINEKYILLILPYEKNYIIQLIFLNNVINNYPNIQLYNHPQCYYESIININNPFKNFVDNILSYWESINIIINDDLNMFNDILKNLNRIESFIYSKLFLKNYKGL